MQRYVEYQLQNGSKVLVTVDDWAALDKDMTLYGVHCLLFRPQATNVMQIAERVHPAMLSQPKT